ncbi:zinc finger SWIM domain protein [Halorubrum saccharovorum]|uniref:Zinc finger SWIM domain protein n=1 Tax=Halorubrum saccharovorum TaxID=2248 RepID=A0A081EWQ3_9EURY|nr:zinc finger SWIM domain protein [Halorubrum saccharovorum]
MAALSPTDVVDVLDADEQVEKRAAWEAFEFALLGDGDVEVTNGSHGDAGNHTYTVHVESGIPSHCTCPAWEYQPGVCKHMVAVGIREPVLEAATEDQQVRADGGVTLKEFGADDRDEDGCWCDDHQMPCFDCYNEGRRTLPGEGE